jgi:hypothetical protein
VLRDLEQIDDAEKTRGARQSGSDIGEADGLDRIHLDLTFFHAVTVAGLNVRTRPDTDAAGDFAGTDSVAETFSEYHVESFTIRAA